MATVVTATDLRTKIREVIQRAQFQSDHVIVTVFDKPAVAIIGIDDYREYLVHKEQQQRQNQKRWERLRAMIERDATLDKLTDEELIALIEGVRAAGRVNHRDRPRDGDE
jgi:prevent-host-death family protein